MVLAGVNGSGKSSSGGALLRRHGLSWFNPDMLATKLVGLGWSREDANGAAWSYGKRKLEEAMAERSDFAFETTLGGTTMASLLKAAAKTHDITMFFFGLASVEQHVARVKLRVRYGGHDIPEPLIRARWARSRENLVSLLPALSDLQLFDNSTEAAPGEDIPAPKLVLDIRGGDVRWPKADDREALEAVPDWAKPIVAAALKLRQ